MSLSPDPSYKINVFKVGSTVYARTSTDRRIIASSSNDLGSVLDTVIDSLTSGGSIRISGDSYGWATNVTCVNPRIGIFCETGNTITPNAGHTGDLFTVDNEHFTFDYGNIDCSNMSNGTGSVFKIGTLGTQSDLARIMRCRIKNPPITGIWMGANSYGLYAVDNSIQSFFSPTGHAILLSSSGDHMIKNNHIGGFGNGSAITLSGGGPCVLQGNEIFSSLRGINCYVVTDAIISNNLIQACTNMGIRVLNDLTSSHSNVIINGNRIHNNSQNPTNTHPGIWVGATNTGIYEGIQIIGNTISDNQASPTQKHGIEFNGAKFEKCVIANNSIYKNLSIPINAYNVNQSCSIHNNITDVRSLPYHTKSQMGVASLGHNRGRKYGAFLANNVLATGVGDGFMSTGITAVTVTAAGFANDFATGRYMITNTGSSQDTAAGIRNSTIFTMRGWYPRYKARFKLSTSISGVRLWAGLTSNNTGNPNGDTELTSKHGIMLAARSTDTNFQIASSNGTATFANALSAGGAAKAIDLDTVHTIEICADDANNKWWYSFDDGGWNAVTATIPAQTTGLTGILMIQNSTATDLVLHSYYMELETDG